MSAHEIDYEIFGDDMQYVEVELDPGESVLSEAGAMMYMTQEVAMETSLGGSSATSDDGVLGKLMGAGKRLMTGESLFITSFTHGGKAGKQRVAFAAPYPGKIFPLDLAQLGTVLCQKDSYLCSAMGIDVNMAFHKKLGAGLFGGEGFILQKLSGDGLAFVHAGGTMLVRDLAPGEQLKVDTGCIVAFQESCDYDIKYVGNVKSALFGGEGVFFAQLTGPGKVVLQSLPFSRLAGRVYKAAPQTTGGGSQGEGGILGRFLQGDGL